MIDYEAALDAFVLAQAQLTNGVYHPKTGQLIREAMIRAVVAAALGDTVLYREATELEWETGRCSSISVVRVWPKEDNDEPS
jgi:hypothetical protein